MSRLFFLWLILLMRSTAVFAQTSPDDPLHILQWHHQAGTANGPMSVGGLSSAKAWAMTTGGTTPAGDTIVVAVIDAGVDHLHPDLKGNLWRNRAEIPDDGLDNDDNGYIDDVRGWNVAKHNDDISGISTAHGTPLCGIIGASGNNALGTTGINWTVRIMVVVTGGTVADVLEAYDYVLQARKRYNATGGKEGAFVVAINNSFGTDFGQPAQAPLWCAAFDSLGRAGILSVAATANQPVDVDAVGDLPTTCPSDYLITVTNLDSTNHKAAQAAWGTQHVDVGAYGQDVFSTAALGSYGYFQGTSFAAPMVAGALVLLYSAPCPDLIALTRDHPADAALWAKKQLLGSTLPSNSLQGITLSGGRLNLGAFMEQYQTLCPACPAPFDLQYQETDGGLHHLFWKQTPVHQAFQLRWRITDSPDWQWHTQAGNSFLLPDLLPCTAYEYQVRGQCSDQLWSDWSWPHRFRSTGCCAPPAQIQMSQPLPNTATLSWAASPQAQGYRLRVRPQGATEWWMYDLDVPAHTLTDLQPCLQYEASVQTRCPALGDAPFSPPYFFSLKGCEACMQAQYCEAKAEQSSKEWISVVQIGTWVNASPQAGSGYQNFTTNLLQSPTLTGGTAAPVTITPGFEGQAYKETFRLYIDFNADGDFEDADELAFEPGFAHNGPMSGLLQVPPVLHATTTRMRVMMKYALTLNELPQPCEIFDYGQVEDYCVHLLPKAINPVAEAYPSHPVLVCYPQPAQQVLHLALKGYGPALHNVQFRAWAAEGRNLPCAVQATGKDEWTLDTSSWPSGLYWLQLQADGYRVGTKIQVLRH